MPLRFIAHHFRHLALLSHLCRVYLGLCTYVPLNQNTQHIELIQFHIELINVHTTQWINIRDDLLLLFYALSIPHLHSSNPHNVQIVPTHNKKACEYVKCNSNNSITTSSKRAYCSENYSTKLQF